MDIMCVGFEGDGNVDTRRQRAAASGAIEAAVEFAYLERSVSAMISAEAPAATAESSLSRTEHPPPCANIMNGLSRGTAVPATDVEAS